MFTIYGIGEVSNNTKNGVDLRIFPRFSSSFVLHTKAIVMRKLTKICNEVDDINKFDHLNNLCLADPSFNKALMDIVLGAGEFSQIIKPGSIKTSPNQPIAQDTELGWIVSGVSTAENQMRTHVELTSMITNIELTKQLKRFFENDDFIDVPSETVLTDEKQYCEKHYQENVYRNESGRYVVKSENGRWLVP